MQFENPKEFAEYIKIEQHEYAAEPDDMELRIEALKSHYAKEIKNTLFTLPREFTPLKTTYDEVVQLIVEEFYSTLLPQVRKQFENRFYFTTIDNRGLNASIKRSNDGRFYGVFVYSALITVLHRHGKLRLSIAYPESVKFCSRFPNKPATRKMMVEIYAEVYHYFLATKLPHGPQVLLSESLNNVHLQRLDIQEKLIIFHEIAHFLNGDLNSNVADRQLIPPFDNSSYQREHLADIVGFALLLRQFKHTESLTREMRYLILLCLIDLFNVQHEIQGIETSVYPHPLNRMSMVIDRFYGAATEEWVADAILNHNMDKLTLSNFPAIDTDDEPIFAYIEQQLVEAFKN
jgi:hypothetical protein